MRLAKVACVVGCGLVGSVDAQNTEDNGYTNLQLLPQDISREALGQTMVGFLQGLGLPRLGGEGCLYCHEGSMEVPRTEWDFASDAKPMKSKGRAMLAMTQQINDVHLAGLDTRIDSEFEVSCITCHLGRTDPRPLDDVLWSTFQSDGFEKMSQRFKELKNRYEGTQAYDFRAGTLSRVAAAVAGEGDTENAIAVAQLNVEALPEDVSAWRTLLILEMDKLVEEKGVESALAHMDSMEESAPNGAIGFRLLDSLAWRLNRSSRAEAGSAVIDANLKRHPGVYVPLESKAFILRRQGKIDEAIRLLESWIAEHPNHERAKNLLVNMRGGN